MEEAWAFIAQDSPEEAEKFVSRLEEQMRLSSVSPNAVLSFPENEILGTRYRHLIYGNYRNVFRVEGKTVYVLRVIHSARLLDSSMFEE